MYVYGREHDAEVFIESLLKWFPHVFVELQHHNITHDEDPEAMILTDDDMVEQLVVLADRIGLPVIATADNHYLIEREKSAHSLMKEMTRGSVEDAFPGDSFHLPGGLFVKEHYSDEVWDQCLEGSDQLLSLNKLVIPALDKYRPRVPTVHKHAQGALHTLVYDVLADKIADGSIPQRRAKTYRERLAYELEVIEKLGQANYMLLWDKVVQWCRNEHICIEARGSANGSLVCFLVGITQVDPVEWGVTFDRFLSIDRIKPPDIDMDIEDVRRGDLIRYLKTSFDVIQIGTWLEIGTTIDQDGAEKGSVLQTFRTYVAREAEKPYLEWRQANKVPGTNRLPTDPAMAKAAQDDKQLVYATIQDMADVKRFFPQYYPGLKQIAGMGSVYKSYGVHAGGLLLSGDDLKISQWIPTMLVASSDTIVSQFDMDQVEQWGLLKLDVLGQRSLRIMRLTQEMIGRDNPTDFSWIPKDDPDAMALLRKSRVGNGVFHAEGYSKAIGFKKMKPKTVRDIILGTALFMPGAMDTGQTERYLERRFHPEKRDRVFYPHPIFKEVLGPTYGALVFQEQTLNILRGLGMDIADINMMFKIVKDSGKGAVERNVQRLAPIRAKFDDLCDKAGVKLDKNGTYDKAWEWITGIVAYAFNQAHASGYGIRTYRFAYLKAHYPLEFHTALLIANAGTKKEDQYIREVLHEEVPMLPPDVNISGDNWTLDREMEAIRKGLLSIPGVGVNAALAITTYAPYTSIEDFCIRCDERAVSGRKNYLKDGTYSGTVKALRDAGAFKSMMKGKTNGARRTR